MAAQEGYEQIVQLLLDKGVNVDLTTQVILLIVSFFFFQFLIFLFYSFNVKDGTTPLYIAAQNGYEQIVQLLVGKGGANVDLADEVILLIVNFSFSFLLSQFSIFLNVKDGATPLHIAAQKGYVQIVQILLDKGVNVDFANKVLLFNDILNLIDLISFAFSFFTF